VDSFDLDQCEIAFAIFGRTHLSGNRVPRAEIELADLRWRDIDVIRTRKIVVVGRAEESETIRKRFQNAFTENEPAFFGLRLQDFENQFLLPHSGSTLDVKVLSDLRQRSDVHLLQLRDVHGGCAFWAIRGNEFFTHRWVLLTVWDFLKALTLPPP